MNIIDSVDWNGSNYDEVFTELTKIAVAQEKRANTGKGYVAAAGEKLNQLGAGIKNLMSGVPGSGQVVSEADRLSQDNLRKALIGAGLGGGVGLLSTMFRKKKKPISDTLYGALLGGLGGASFNMARNIVNDIDKTPPQGSENSSRIKELNSNLKKLEDATYSKDRQQASEARKEIANIRRDQKWNGYGDDLRSLKSPFTSWHENPVETVLLGGAGATLARRAHQKHKADVINDFVGKNFNNNVPDTVDPVVDSHRVHLRNRGIKLETPSLFKDPRNALALPGSDIHKAYGLPDNFLPTNPAQPNPTPPNPTPPNPPAHPAAKYTPRQQMRMLYQSALKNKVGRPFSKLRGAGLVALPYVANSLVGNTLGPRVSKLYSSPFDFFTPDSRNYDKVDALVNEAINRGLIRGKDSTPDAASDYFMESAMNDLNKSQ